MERRTKTNQNISRAIYIEIRRTLSSTIECVCERVLRGFMRGCHLHIHRLHLTKTLSIIFFSFVLFLFCGVLIHLSPQVVSPDCSKVIAVINSHMKALFGPTGGTVPVMECDDGNGGVVSATPHPDTYI